MVARQSKPTAKAAFLDERAALNDEIDRELSSLVQTKGWAYAQRVAHEVQEKFNCDPTHPDWHVYTTVQYALNQLFGKIRIRANDYQRKRGTVAVGQSITAEIKEKHESKRNSIRGNEPTDSLAEPRRRRTRLG